ncbi:M56 family metallopeptidase [Labilibacter marinus]|uniref:M56 family metallopeptidase n=1 Tax=Labilibacter marinus TaxID=1477105 RepID=UPI001301983D|nr:M56 family metallopeptidase [Labilibacter marinus]
MEHIQAILLKSSVALAAFLLVYYTFLRKTSDFNIHRAFLMVGLGLAIVLPFVNITYPVYVQMEMPEYLEIATDTGVETIAVATPDIVSVERTDWSNILFWIYCAVSSLFIIRLMISVIFGIRLTYKAKKVKWRDTYLYIHSSVNNPMVFGNQIFLKDSTYLQPEKEQVLIHEQIHQQQRHWVDMLMSELLLAMAWFNPLAYIYRKTVLNNLEYIADRGVLNTGLQLNTYIQSILCETMGAETIVLANHFRTSQNKQRLKMMKNVKQSKYGKWKLLTILPLLGIMLWAFSEPEYVSKDEVQAQVSNIERTELVKGRALQTDTLEVRQEDGTYQQQIVVGGLRDVNVVIKGTNLGTFTNDDGKFELKMNVGDVLVFSHLSFKTKEIKYTGQEYIGAALAGASPRVLKSEKYRAKYFGKANNNIKLKEVNTKPSNSKGDEMFMAVEELPQYKYGMETYFAQLYSKSAKIAKEKGFKGSADVRFYVDQSGNVNWPAVSGDSEAELKEAAVKIVKELNDWIPAKQRGNAVSYSYSVKVEF